MHLDSKYYSYCKKVGVMKENYSKEHALKRLIEAIEEDTGVHPEFTKKVQSLTLSSPEVSVRACMLYQYDINLEYVVNGRSKTTQIFEFGKSGVPDGLAITEYKGEGEFTTITDFSGVPYTLYNDRNIFTYEEMKKALEGVIERKLPSGWSRYESHGWSVSLYVVPVLVVIIPFQGKDYQLSYNMQNGHYCWNNPDDPALIKKGKTAKMIAGLVRVASVALSILGVILNFAAGIGAILIPLIITVVQILLWKKNKKGKKFFEKFFIQKPKASMFGALKHMILPVILAIVALIV